MVHMEAISAGYLTACAAHTICVRQYVFPFPLGKIILEKFSFDHNLFADARCIQALWQSVQALWNQICFTFRRVQVWMFDIFYLPKSHFKTNPVSNRIPPPSAAPKLVVLAPTATSQLSSQPLWALDQGRKVTWFFIYMILSFDCKSSQLGGLAEGMR